MGETAADVRGNQVSVRDDTDRVFFVKEREAVRFEGPIERPHLVAPFYKQDIGLGEVDPVKACEGEEH